MIFKPSQETILKAAQLLKNGELVAFPTETVYGLGANALSDQAVKKIFALKKRPASNPIIVHVYSVNQALELINPNADPKLLERFKKVSVLWPGPLSLIIPKIPGISNLVSAGGESIAIRIPEHPIALEILKVAGIPIAAPSANKSFAVSPTTAFHVQESFGDQLMIIDGGPCDIGIESTVLNLCGDLPEIMRPGAISAEQISTLLGESCLHSPKIIDHKISQESLTSPGLFDLHYAPSAPLLFIQDLATIDPVNRLGVILFSPALKSQFEGKATEIKVLSLSGNLEEVAKSLYQAIRELDKKNLDLIAIETCNAEGIGVAIMDRLRRARHFPSQNQ